MLVLHIQSNALSKQVPLMQFYYCIGVLNDKLSSHVEKIANLLINSTQLKHIE